MPNKTKPNTAAPRTTIKVSTKPPPPNNFKKLYNGAILKNMDLKKELASTKKMFFWACLLLGLCIGAIILLSIRNAASFNQEQFDEQKGREALENINKFIEDQ